MASSGGIKAGKAFVELYGEDSKLVRTLKANEIRLKEWGGKIAGIGAMAIGAGSAVLTPLIAAAKLFSDAGSDMADMAGRTGASVEALSSLGYAAEQSGSSLEELEGGLKKQAKFLTEAAQGGKAQNEVLKRMGLTIGQLATMSPEEQFRTISAELAKIQNPTLRAATAMEIFGKSGANLLPMISQLGELEERARSLGLVMSSEDAAAADTLGDAWGDLIGMGKMLVFQVGAALAPLLTDLVTSAINLSAGFIGWVKANRETIVTVAKIAAAVAAVGVGLVVLGGIISGVGIAFGILASVATFIASAVGVIGAGLAFLVSPIGLVLVALGALTAWFFTATKTGRSAVQYLIDIFTTLYNEATEAFGGITDALVAGDWGGAMDIAGQFLKVQWKKVTVFFWDQWNNFLSMFLSGSIDIAKRVAGVFVEMGVMITEQIINLTQTLSKLLGKDLVDPRALAAVKGALPILRIGLKNAAGNKLDDFAGQVKAKGAAGSEEAKDDLAKARKDFQDSVAAARKKREQRALGAAPSETQTPIPDLRAGLEAAKFAVSGTFSAAQASGIGGSQKIDEIATNTSTSNKYLKKIAANAGGLAFS